MSAKKNVVLVGGGGAGAKLARTLSEQLDGAKYTLTLISARPYFIHLVAALRLLVVDKDNLEDQMLIPYDRLFINDNGRFKQGTVTSIEVQKESMKGGRVVLESGEIIDYDVLVLAPGSKWESFLDFPFDGKNTQAHIKKWRDQFGKVDTIAIAGGGPVGIELAGELAEFYPEKSITLVHGEKQLLNGAYPDKFRSQAERCVREGKVRLILDDYIDTFPAAATRKGVPLDADLVIPARGPRPNTDFIGASLGKDVLTQKNYVKIEPTMQVAGYRDIFAMGDIIDYPEQKQVGKYGWHSDVVAKNIVSVLNDVEPVKQYKGVYEMIFITFGKWRGAGFFDLLWGLIFGNWVVSICKGRSLLIPATRKDMGY